MDVNTDVMVLELLQDVPPEWNQYTAAWTAARPSLNTTFAGIGHPKSDSQTFFAGRQGRCGGGVAGAQEGWCCSKACATRRAQPADERLHQGSPLDKGQPVDSAGRVATEAAPGPPVDFSTCPHLSRLAAWLARATGP